MEEGGVAGQLSDHRSGGGGGGHSAAHGRRIHRLNSISGARSAQRFKFNGNLDSISTFYLFSMSTKVQSSLDGNS